MQLGDNLHINQLGIPGDLVSSEGLFGSNNPLIKMGMLLGSFYDDKTAESIGGWDELSEVLQDQCFQDMLKMAFSQGSDIAGDSISVQMYDHTGMIEVEFK